MVETILTMEEFQKVLKSTDVVVVDFYATWCGPCKMIGPKIEAMAKEFKNIKFCKVDVDEAEEVAQQYKISAMPTIIFIKDKEKVEEVVGANEKKIRELVEKYSDAQQEKK